MARLLPYIAGGLGAVQGVREDKRRRPRRRLRLLAPVFAGSSRVEPPPEPDHSASSGGGCYGYLPSQQQEVAVLPQYYYYGGGGADLGGRPPRCRATGPPGASAQILRESFCRKVPAAPQRGDQVPATRQAAGVYFCKFRKRKYIFCKKQK